MVDSINFTGRAEEAHKIAFDNPTEYLKRQFDGGTIDSNLTHLGCVKRMGWSYDFRPFLKRFVFKQYDSWHESYAPNKTCLRKVVCGSIDEIHELPNKHAVK